MDSSSNISSNITSTSSILPSISQTIILPIQLWKGYSFWKIPYNGIGLPEKRHVTIKKSQGNGKHAIPISFISKTPKYLSKDSKIFYPCGLSECLPSPMTCEENIIQGYIFYPITLIWYSGIVNKSSFTLYI